MYAALPAVASALPLQFGVFTSQIGRLLLAVVAIGIVVFVGRFVLAVAWKLVVIAAVVIGLLWLFSTFLG